MGGNRQGSLEEVSADPPSVSVCNSKIIQIWNGRKFVAVKIQRTLCGGRNTETIIDYACFYQKLWDSTYSNLNFIWVHVFAMKIIQNWYQSRHVPGFLSYNMSLM